MFEAYAVGVRLTLINGVSSGLVSLASQFQGLNRHVITTQSSVGRLEASLLQLKRLGLVGGALAAAGGLGLALFKGPLEEAAEYQKEVARLSVMGVGDSALKDAMKFADGMNIMGQSARDNMKLIREAYAVTGDMHHAEALAPQLARMKFGIDAVLGEGHGSGAQTMMMDLLKTAELRGAANDPATFARMTNLAMKAYVASGGTVAPRDFLSAMKTGGVAAKGLTDEAFFFQGLHTMQEFGGSRYGTAMMSAYQNLAQGRGSLRSAKQLVDMGLIDPSMIEYTKIGTIKQVKPGALKDSFTMAQNQFEFYEKNVAPKLEGLSKQDAFLKIGSMFSNRTAANLFSTFYNDAPSIRRVFQMAKQADGIDGVYDKAGKTASGQMLDLQAKWRDVLKDLGMVVLPVAIKAVQGLSSVLKTVVDFGREFPGITRSLVTMFGVLSVAAAAGGAIMLTKAAIGGLTLALGGGGAAVAGAAVGTGGLIVAAGLAAAGVGAIAYSLFDLYKATNHDGVKFAPGISGRLRDPQTQAQMAALDGDFKVNSVRSAPGKVVQVSTNISLDGRSFAKVMTQHQAAEASRPAGGFSGFDPNLGLAPFALTNIGR